MSDEKKQIDEMADVIFEKSPIPSVWRSDAVKFAKALYNEGYRKQKVGEWIEQYRDWDMPPFYYIDFTCSVCDQREQQRSPYCRWCGARMKGDKEDGC